MPDPIKIAKMREAGVRLVESCATCAHGPAPQHAFRPWGRCALHRYHHTKHGERSLPSHITFVCDSYERAQDDRFTFELELGDYFSLLNAGADQQP